MQNLPDENTKRFIAVLNKKIEIGRLLNALGHMATGLAAGSVDRDEICLLQYVDKEGGAHPNISHYPFIVLKAENSNQIRKIRQEALRREILFTDFTSSMIVGTSTQQQQATRDTSELDLEYFGICMFGPTEPLREITGKLSLFKSLST